MCKHAFSDFYSPRFIIFAFTHTIPGQRPSPSTSDTWGTGHTWGEGDWGTTSSGTSSDWGQDASPPVADGSEPPVDTPAAPSAPLTWQELGSGALDADQVRAAWAAFFRYRQQLVLERPKSQPFRRPRRCWIFSGEDSPSDLPYL
ncbi:hypothetical protein B0H14DRAFT_3442308 [Mycena olivaceomarginata]|nr:hypothetical protein B0H14DRAFT_3442308 [Mycena olivaceomarginata]